MPIKHRKKSQYSNNGGGFHTELCARTNGRVAEIESVDSEHSQEQRESDCHIVVVARPTSITQLTARDTHKLFLQI